MNPKILRYPLKIGTHTYPRGTLVDVLSADDPEVKKIFPDIKNNQSSNQVALAIYGRNKPSGVQDIPPPLSHNEVAEKTGLTKAQLVDVVDEIEWQCLPRKIITHNNIDEDTLLQVVNLLRLHYTPFSERLNFG